MRKYIAALLGLLLWSGIAEYAHAQAPGLACPNSAIFNTSSSGLAQIVGLTAGQSIYICGWGFFAGGTTAAQLEYGTGTNCAAGTIALTPPMPFIAQTGFSYPATQPAFVAPVGNAVCVNNGSAAQITGFITYYKS